MVQPLVQRNFSRLHQPSQRVVGSLSRLGHPFRSLASTVARRLDFGSDPADICPEEIWNTRSALGLGEHRGFSLFRAGKYFNPRPSIGSSGLRSNYILTKCRTPDSVGRVAVLFDQGGEPPSPPTATSDEWHCMLANRTSGATWSRNSSGHHRRGGIRVPTRRQPSCPAIPRRHASDGSPVRASSKACRCAPIRIAMRRGRDWSNRQHGLSTVPSV